MFDTICFRNEKLTLIQILADELKFLRRVLRLQVKVRKAFKEFEFRTFVFSFHSKIQLKLIYIIDRSGMLTTAHPPFRLIYFPFQLLREISEYLTNVHCNDALVVFLQITHCRIDFYFCGFIFSMDQMLIDRFPQPERSRFENAVSRFFEMIQPDARPNFMVVR